MKFPYGIANFEAVISEGYEYVDRTAFLPLLEDASKQWMPIQQARLPLAQ